jgi:molybdopterin converting factor small subunit
MQIDVKLYGDLKQFVPGGQTDFVLTLNSGATLGDVLKMVSIPMDRCVSLINGRRATIEAPIEDGDILVLFPPVSGG